MGNENGGASPVDARTSTRRWREALELAGEWFDLDERERGERLEALRQSDPALYPDVVRLIHADQVADEDSLPLPEIPAMTGELAAGATFGPYRIESQLGAGGMGEVWLATRSDELYEGRVAIKVLHAHLARSAARTRFSREGHILGTLTHPHIARLLDAGVAADGAPFLVLEHVPGERIDRWCDARSLGIAARLRLFLDVCDAVSHAHSHLVVHRDLKPSNILVAGDGDVKLLDFGIAKLLEGSATAAPSAQETQLTMEAGRALTPEYAAPEQILGDAITTATDVYSLGVVLYGLLCGKLPHAGNTASTPLVAHEILTADLRPPSTRIAASDGEIATARGGTPQQLRAALRGDLDVIIGKALRKNPADRYASVSTFAEDLRRHLAYRPVLARPDALGYRIRKYLRRNRTAALVGGAAATGLVALGVSVLLNARATARHAVELAGRDRELTRVAEFESKLLQRVQVEPFGSRLVARMRERLDQGLTGSGAPTAEREQKLALFDSFEPLEGAPEAARQTIAESILVPAEKEISNYADTPRLEADLRMSLGESYKSITLMKEAETQFRRAIQVYEGLGTAEGRRKALESRFQLVEVLSDTGGKEGFVEAARALERDASALLGPDDPVTLKAGSDVGAALERAGDLATAEATLTHTHARQLAILGADHRDTLDTEVKLASVLIYADKLDAGYRMAEEAYQKMSRLFGEEDVRALAARNMAADARFGAGALPEAETDYRAISTIWRRTRGSDDLLTLKVISNLASVLETEGRYAEAEPLSLEAWTGLRKAVGDLALSTQIGLNNYASLLSDNGRPHEAIPLLEQLVRTRTQVFGAEHPRTLFASANLGHTLTIAGRVDDAVTLLRRTREIQVRVLGPSHGDTLIGESFLVSALAVHGEVKESRALVAQMMEAARKASDVQGKPEAVLKRIYDALDGSHLEDEKAAFCAKYDYRPAAPGT